MVSDAQIARILMYSGLNYDYDEIAAEVGVSVSTVGKYINELEDEAKADNGVDPEVVFYQAMLGDLVNGEMRENIAYMLATR